MSYYIDMRKPAVVANSGFAVMWANVDPEQGGLPKEQAARVLRKACMWLNTDEEEESKVPMEYTIRPHASGYECIAYTRDADDPKNWRQRDIAETAEEAGALILKWDAFYAVFAKPAEEPEVKGEPRTFEEVIEELSADDSIAESLRLMEREQPSPEDDAIFVLDGDPDEERCAMLTILRDGSARIVFEATAQQLVAISTACAEIAKGRKEDEQ